MIRLPFFGLKIWLILGLFAAVLGATYYAGGIGPRAELKALVAEVKYARGLAKMRDDEREAKHQRELKDKDREREESNAAVALEFDAYIFGLHNLGSGAGKGSKPIPITAQRCDSPADNEAVSAAINRYREDLRSADRSRREAVARLLEEAQRQTDALVRMQEWANNEREINR